MRWQRAVRWILIAVLAAVVAAVWNGLRGRPADPDDPVRPVARSDQRAVTETAAGETRQWKNERSNLDLRFERRLSYEDGRERYYGIEATVPGRGGRAFRISADEGEVGPDQAAVVLRGHLRIVTSDGVTVEGDEGSYSQGEGVVRLDGPVRFTRGRLTGTGVGMTYDEAREVLWILDRAVVDVAPAEHGGGAMHMVAAAAGFARADQYVRFEGRADRRVRVERDRQTLQADQMVAYLTTDGERLQAIEMRGGSTIGHGQPSPGGLESIAGRDINMAYGEDGHSLQRVLVAGTGVLRLAGERGRPGRRLAAEWLDLGLAGDGSTLASLSGRDQVALDLPTDGTIPARTVRSETIDGRESSPGAGLTAVSFTGQVEFREVSPGGAARLARSPSMAVTTAPGFGEMESARFEHGVEFEEGALRARAPEARYEVAKGQLRLAGTTGPSGQKAELIDEEATINAERIDVDLDTRRVSATAQVNAIMRSSDAGRRGQTGRPAGTGTRLFTDDQPTSAMSDALTYDGEAGRALYVGHARLWQGATTVEADRVDVDDEAGSLVATGSARTSLPLTQIDAKTGRKETVVSRGTGREFRYDEANRLAVFTKEESRPATLVGPDGDLKAARIEIHFRADANAVERLEAHEAVELRLADGRVGTGARLSYFAADERYVMSGDPVKVVDVCDVETTARTLTFFKSADRIVVDGNEERRTQTKGGAKCPATGVRKAPHGSGSG